MRSAILRRRRPRLELLEIRALLASATGTLDSSFGAGFGFVTVPNAAVQPRGNSRSELVGEVVQPDGKIVIGGTITANSLVSFRLERFNADGTLDMTFGTDGVFSTNVSYDNVGNASAVLLQSDGSIIEAGDADQYDGPDIKHGGTPRYIAIRVTSNGTIDSTYGAAGVASPPPGSAVTTGDLTYVNAAALQSDGELVLAGADQITNSNNYVFTAVRIDATGSLDTTFGTDGIASVPIKIGGTATTFSDAQGAAVQSNGQIVLAGSSSSQSEVLTRLNVDGAQDSTFGGSGSGGVVVVASNPASVGSQPIFDKLALQSDDKILISGFDQTTPPTAYLPSLIRLDADGTPDARFGQLGRVATAVYGPVVELSDSTIVVGGSYQIPRVNPESVTNPRSEFSSVGLNTDGSADASYGNTTTPGLAQYYFGTASYDSSVSAAAIRPTDGDIVLAGVATTGAGLDQVSPFAVAAVHASASTAAPATRPAPAPPVSLSGFGQTDLAFYVPTFATFAYLAIGDTLSETVAFGIPGTNQTIPAVADYAGVGQSQIAAYLTAGGYYAIRPVSGPDQVFQFGIPGVGQSIPVPADYEGTGKADVAIYMPSIAAYAILPSSGAQGRIVQLGQAGLGNSIPAPADYFHTGQADLAVYLSNFGAFAVADPTGKTSGAIVPFGTGGQGDIPVPGDYDGSGHVELAIYVPTYGAFFYRPYAGGPDKVVTIGTAGAGMLPIPGDYDGSGHLEFAVYDPSNGIFTYRPASGGADVAVPYGAGYGATLPPAAPAGALPVFSGSSSSSGFGVHITSIAVGSGSGSSGQVSAASVSLGRSTSVPSGPALASVRVAKTLVNQGIAEPSTWGD